MANNKGKPKGVLFYENWIDLMCDYITPEQTIELLKMIRAEYNGEIYNTECTIVKSNWFHIKPQLQSNLQKYTNICERNMENGMKGGRPKKVIRDNNITQKTQSVIFETQNKQSKSKSETESESESKTFTSVKGEENTSTFYEVEDVSLIFKNGFSEYKL